MKRYTFEDCVRYASKHGIQFDVRTRDGYLYNGLWIVISDAYDGYCSSENVEFIPELYGYKAFICYDRGMFKKDYVLVSMLENVFKNYPSMLYIAACNSDCGIWYGTE